MDMSARLYNYAIEWEPVDGTESVKSARRFNNSRGTHVKHGRICNPIDGKPDGSDIAVGYGDDGKCGSMRRFQVISEDE